MTAYLGGHGRYLESDRPSYTACMIDTKVSSPMKSASSAGWTGAVCWPRQGRSAVDAAVPEDGMQDQDYDTDLSLWSEGQARALRDAGRAGTNLPIDWENVAEEIEALGKSQARELVSCIRTILVRLLKLQASPATEPRAGWRETIAERRTEIERMLEDSPSLRERAGQVIAKELEPARRQVLLALASYEEAPRIDVAQISYAEAEVLGDWFPD